jgi:methionyl aminopeptidase
MEIATRIEAAVRKIIVADKIEAGLAFPCGTSINNCAAHFTANAGDTKVLTKNDVVKIDFGTHVKGFLIDSAFTVAFDPVFDNLVIAAKEATQTGVREAGIDARFDEIGERIQEKYTK